MSVVDSTDVRNLTIENIQIVFSLGKGVVEAVSQFDLTVREGESVCIVGHRVAARPACCGRWRRSSGPPGDRSGW